MLAGWVLLTSVTISGYLPLAEQTWVALDPAWYPPGQPVPQVFVAWHGNQYPVLDTEQRNGRWQLLFPVRLTPPFTLFEGQASPTRRYLERLKRIDEMAYGIDLTAAPPASGVTAGLVPARSQAPFMPGLAGWQEPWPGSAVSGSTTAGVPVNETYVAGKPCHQVVAGETLWRVADRLARSQGGDTYAWVLALNESNRERLGPRAQTRVGSWLTCPVAKQLVRYQSMTIAARQAAVVALVR